MQIKKFLLLFGYVFLIWGLFDILLKSSIYGFRELNFIWFCSITLFLLAFGLILKNKILLNSFLSMALLVQPFWILDYIWNSFFNVSLNGFASYIFQPGHTLLEFIDTFRHMFMIPFGFYAVFIISRKSIKSYFFIPMFIIILLGASYFFAPEYSNTNCVLEPCVKAFGGWLSGIQYFIFFLFGTVVLSLIINFIINILLERYEKVRNKKFYKRLIFFIFIVLLTISFVSIAAASLRYSKIPKYSCVPDNCFNCTVNLKCNYVSGNQENQKVIYTIKNYGNEVYVCEVYMRIDPKDKKYKKIAEGYYILPNKKYKVGQHLDYPEFSSQIRLKLNCSLYQNNLE